MDNWFGDSGVGAQQSQVMQNRMHGPQTVYCLFTQGYDAVCGFPGCAPSVQCRVEHEFPARLNGIVTPQYLQQLKNQVNMILSRHIIPQIPFQFIVLETERDNQLRRAFREASAALPQGYHWEYNGLDSLRWSFVANLNMDNLVESPIPTAVAQYQVPVAVVVQAEPVKKAY